MIWIEDESILVKFHCAQKVRIKRDRYIETIDLVGTAKGRVKIQKSNFNVETSAIIGNNSRVLWRFGKI